MSAVIFGASAFGKAALKHLGSKFDIEFFCDNSKEKQGTFFCGKRVLCPEQLSGMDIIIASYYNLAIAKQLIDMGIKDFYAAFDNGRGEIEESFINLSQFESLSIDKNKLCLVCEYNSGSNTLAMSKLVKDTDYNFVLINERHKDVFYYYHILTSGVVFRTHEGSLLESSINIQLWHGIGLKPLGYMSRKASKYGETRHAEWMKLDAVFSYSQMYNLILSACYGVPENKFYITGAPRNDFLFKTDGRGLLSEMSNINTDCRLILYAPTFREDVFGIKAGLGAAYLYDMPDIDINGFNEFLGAHNCKMVIKTHPRDIADAEKRISGLGNISLLTDSQLYEKDLEFYEVLNAFDGLITDYSSLASDFLLLDRPIVYLPLDKEQYEKDMGFLLKPYDFWCPGEKVYTYEALKKSIVNMFEADAYSEHRKQIRDIFHEYKDGESTKRVMDALRRVIEEKAH